MKEAASKNKKYIITFSALLILCWMFPYTGDDWAWGSSIGIERLNTLFEGYSGRYLGNFIVLLLTRSNILKTAVMALTITAVIKCAEKIGNTKKSFYYACLFLLLTPKLILRQAVIWTSGFSNYCTSAALLLLFLAFAVKDQEIKDSKQKAICTAGLLVLGFANSLIVESITVCSIALSAGLCIYSAVRDRKNIVPYSGYLAGAAAGAALMFSNSVYHNIAAGRDGYRSMAGSDSLFTRMADNYLDSIYYDGFFNNVLLNLSLLMIAVLLFDRTVSLGNIKERQRRWLTISLTVFGVFAVYSTFAKIYFSANDTPGIFALFDALISFAALAAFLLYILLTGYLFGDLRRVLILSAGIIMSIAPLFVVTPIGSRCYFASYAMFIILGCVMLDHMPEDQPHQRTIMKAALAAIITLYLTYASIFAVISITNARRLDAARKAAEEGRKEVVFTILPFDSFLWTAAPTEGIWADRYKLFYGLPEDLVINVKERKS